MQWSWFLCIMFIVLGNGHDDPGPNPGRGCFHFVSHLEKVCIKLFSLLQWVNSRSHWDLIPMYGNQSRRKKEFEFKPVQLRLKIDLVSHPCKYIHNLGEVELLMSFFLILSLSLPLSLSPSLSPSLALSLIYISITAIPFRL